MNKFKLLTLISLLFASHLAAADIRTITLASEVALSDFRAPASANGTAQFKACPDCETQNVNVTPGTRYKLNGRVVPLAKFRNALARVSKREKETVIVMHHLESDVITSISINLLST